MLTEEARAEGDATHAPLDSEALPSDDAAKIAEHEAAAHEKRNWVRLTFDCNDHCVFCLDSHTHTGEMRAREEVKQQILDGRRKGATRLILSGGEPTIHPSYVDFVRLGRLAGYRKIQTVTNGRRFAYGDFLTRCLDEGLSEITFSIHGPNGKVHDALVGTKGAWEEEMKGLRGALADGRPIVNIDIVINRANVKHLPEMLRLFTEMGVKEFDLLQVVPFGRAFTDGRDTLFYDLAEARPYLQEALAYSKRPDLHLWLNRFPPQHLEGYEHLIQDPYKLNDEVRGRKEEFAKLLDDGEWLDCRQPERCKYCYLERLCGTLDGVLGRLEQRAFDVVRVDLSWEEKQPPVFGGDPASGKRARLQAAGKAAAEALAASGDAGEASRAGEGPSVAAEPPPDPAIARMKGKRPLPMLASPKRTPPDTLEVALREAKASTLWVVSPDLARVRRELAMLPMLTSLPRLELELEDWSGIEDACVGGAIEGRVLARVVTRRAADAQRLLAIAGDFEVVLELRRENEAWLLGLERAPSRLVLRQPSYERLTEAKANDLDLHGFFARFRHDVPVEDVPACIVGRAPRERPTVLDTAMTDAAGKLEIFRYTRRYLLEHYRTKSLRCRDCVHDASCDGLHVNFVRAHGYAPMRPVLAAEAPAPAAG
jgi:MoaA/NifB/PqqE/SkfB family radical SAM enzyme